MATGMAFSFFSHQRVNVAVVEAGLGGKLDATNVVNPLVSIISSISYDHKRVLGNSLSLIAHHKAGIIKHECPVVIAPQKEEPLLVIRQTANKFCARLIEVDRDYSYGLIRHSLRVQTFFVSRRQENQFVNIKKNKKIQLKIRLLGQHQVENAVTAYAALLTAREEGLSITDKDIKEGFSQSVWPGRFEVLQKSPPVVLDAAHNQDSARRLALSLKDYFNDTPIQLIFGVSEDKDVNGILAELLPFCSRLFPVNSGHARAISPDSLAKIIRRLGYSSIEVSPSVDVALVNALSNAKRDRGLVLATGSIFVVASVRSTWQKSR
jgi:dihydrofolate synthase/folylpolyglutamate synthase